MVRVGKVISINKAERSGLITDFRGREFIFLVKDCKDEAIPKLNTRVTFIKDDDFKTIDVAVVVIPAAA